MLYVRVHFARAIVRDLLSGEGCVIKTVFRKTMLCVCITLTFASGLPIGVLKAPSAHAQPVTTPNPVAPLLPNYDELLNSLPEGLRTSIASRANQPLLLAADLQSGLSQGFSPDALLAAVHAGNPAASLERLTGIQTLLNNISNNPNINAVSANALLTGFLGDQLPASVTSVLSNIEGLGNLNGAQLMELMGTDALQDYINGLPTDVAADFVNTLLATGLSPQGLADMATDAGIEALRDLIDGQLPGLADFMRDFGGIRELLRGNFAALLQGGPAAIVAVALGLLPNGLINLLSPGGGSGCCSRHRNAIPQHYDAVRQSVDTGFDNHRTWFVTVFWEENLLPALTRFASQMTATGIFQVQMIGAMLDAKHQLETQRVFQVMAAKAHKDYQPSEAVCTFATMARGLSASERLSDLAHVGLADFMSQRQTLSAGATSIDSEDSDKRTRIQIYRTTHCEPADNGNGLASFCPNPGDPARRNIDVDFVRNIESRLTLDINLDENAPATPDTVDVIAFLSYVFSNVIAPRIPPGLFGSEQGIRLSVAEVYLKLRAIFAKRSVAQNSLAALIALRAPGDDEWAPYAKANLRNLGMSDEQIQTRLGDNPSVLASLHLTSNIVDDPSTATKFMDTKANVARMALGVNVGILRVDRYYLESLLRGEVILAVLLETMLQKEQEKITADIESISKVGNRS